MLPSALAQHTPQMYPVLSPAHTGGAEYSIEVDKVGPTVQFCGCAKIEKELGLRCQTLPNSLRA